MSDDSVAIIVPDLLRAAAQATDGAIYHFKPSDWVTMRCVQDGVEFMIELRRIDDGTEGGEA